jgi:hypothetical protein
VQSREERALRRRRGRRGWDLATRREELTLPRTDGTSRSLWREEDIDEKGSADRTFQTAAASPWRLHDGHSSRTVWTRPWRCLVFGGRRALDELWTSKPSWGCQLRKAMLQLPLTLPGAPHQREAMHSARPCTAARCMGKPVKVMSYLLLISPRCWPRVSHEPSSQRPARPGPQMPHFTRPRPSAIAHALLARRSRSLATTRHKCARMRLTSDLH